MAGFKDLDFNERREASQKARDAALAKLKARPPMDEAELARRLAKQEARDAALAEKRNAVKQARLEADEKAKADKAEAADAEPTEAELKAARDAKYSARKKRKGKR